MSKNNREPRYNWPTKKLGEVCKIGAGNPAPQNKELFENGAYQFFRTSDVGKIHLGYVEESADKLNAKGIRKLQIHKKGSLLFPKSGASTFLNHRVLMATDGYVSSHLAVLKAINDRLEDRYLLYFSMTVDSRSLMQDQNYPSLRLSDIKDIEIPLPPLPTQHRIVNKLEKIFAGIEKAKQNAEKNLKNVHELFESYLRSVFAKPGKGWEERTLGEIATFRNGMNYTKGSKGETIKIVGVKDFQNNFWAPLEHLSSVTIDGELNDIDYLRANDILAVRSNGNPELIGRTVLARNVVGKVSHSGFTIRIRVNSSQINPIYLCQYLKLSKTRKKLIESGTGINIKSLNQVALSSLQIIFPKSLGKQASIVNRLDALAGEARMLEVIYQKKLADLDELKKSVLRKAFAGKL